MGRIWGKSTVEFYYRAYKPAAWSEYMLGNLDRNGLLITRNVRIFKVQSKTGGLKKNYFYVLFYFYAFTHDRTVQRANCSTIIGPLYNKKNINR